MPTMDLRPLSLGEILDRTFSLYRRFFLLFIGISAIPRLLVLLMNLAQLFLTSSPATLSKVPPPNGVQTAPTITSSGGIVAVAGLGLATLMVTIIAYLLSQGATVTAVSELYLGRTITIGDSFRRVRGELGSLFGVILLNGLVTIVAFLFLIIPGIYVMCRLFVCIPAALIENLGPRDSLERSFALTKGFAGRAFLILLLCFILAFGAAMLFGSPFTAAMVFAKNDPGMMRLWVAMTNVGNYVANVLVTPILTIASSIFYYDLRVRKEAFDLQLMLKPLSGAAPAVSGAPIALS
jgi:hypothetical protein